MPCRSAIYGVVLLLSACGDGAPIGPVPAAIPVAAVQGNGASSPRVGAIVTVTGIVTGDFQAMDGDAADLGGFFLQAERPDGDASTSDAVFVADPPAGPDVHVGERLAVTGVVAEHDGETRVDARDIRRMGEGHVTPTELVLPLATGDANDDPGAGLERLEGMLVRLPQTLTVTDVYGLDRYGELTLSAGGRLTIYTNAQAPDVAGYDRHRRSNARRSLVLDDGSLATWPRPSRYLWPGQEPGPADPIRTGDTVAGLLGVLRYGRPADGAGDAGWRLVPVADPAFMAANPRPAAPPKAAGSVRVMGMNAANFFTTLDTGRDTCGPQRDMNCRGARSAAEFERQLAKLVALIQTSGADVVGLSEIENNGAAALDVLAAALDRPPGQRHWTYVDTGILGSDAIRVAIVYDASALATVGRHAVLDSSVDARYLDRRNRPALAQTFVDLASGGRFTLVANHLKSKSSDCNSNDDPDRQDGQGNCNAVRTAAAVAEAAWLARDPTASGDRDVLVIGDLNAHLREDPLRALEAAGYTNLVLDRIGPAAYSYAFRGQAGTLDHALASPSLAPQVRAVAEWHINADESPAFDYTLPPGRPADFFDGAVPFRASDHDPLIIDLVLDADRGAADNLHKEETR